MEPGPPQVADAPERSRYEARVDGAVAGWAEYRDRGETNRAGPDSLRVTPARVTQRIGDSDAQDALLWLNASIPAGGGDLYAFGGHSERETNSSGFFRTAGDARTVPAVYPNGFLPTIITEPTDTSPPRSDLMVKFRAASYGDREHLLRVAGDRLVEHRARLAMFEQIQERDFPKPDGLEGRERDMYLVLRGGLLLEQFWIDWLTEYLDAHTSHR